MEVIRDGRRIIGFIEEKPNDEWSYAFGKPSQRSYISFTVATKEIALSKLWEYHNSYKGLIRSSLCTK